MKLLILIEVKIISKKRRTTSLDKFDRFFRGTILQGNFVQRRQAFFS